jgi:hypothetical protein|tara:strand:+ start:9356 stop:9991 length:636 start_codon:yes stop_codon:yes gene_type:complete
MENNTTGQIVSLTNPEDEDFEHPYGGVPLFVKAKETKVFPLVEGMHLAKHLARKILMRKDKGKIIGEEQGKGNAIYSLEDEQNLINRLLGSTITPEAEPELTELEKVEARVAKMEEQFGSKVQHDRVNKAGEFGLKLSKEDQAYKDKQDIINILLEKEQKVDRRKSKDDLEAQLNEVLKAEADTKEKADKDAKEKEEDATKNKSKEQGNKK